MAKMQDVRKTIESSLGNLNTARAQEIAKGVLDRDAAKEQVSKTAGRPDGVVPAQPQPA